MAVEVLELVLDASGMQRGAQQASRALDTVKDKSTQAERAVVSSGRALSSAFQTTGGTLQIASGIAQTASAFGQLNLAAAGFSASRVILEVGKTAQDFRDLRGAVGATGGVFSALGAILRAHPLLAIAGVIATAASAMSLFGRSMKTATEETRKQADALDGLLSRTRELNIRASYGEADPRTTVSGTVSGLASLRLTDRSRIGIDDAAGLFGVSGQDFRYSLARSGLGESALEVRYNPFADQRERWAARSAGRPFAPDFSMQDITREQAIAAGELLLRERSQRPMASEQYDQSVIRAGVFGASFHSAKQDMIERERRAQEEQIAAAQRVADILGGVGNELGQALFAAVEGGAGALRTALANLLSSWGQRGFGAAFDAIGRAVAGATTRQSQPAATGGGGTVV